MNKITPKHYSFPWTTFKVTPSKSATLQNRMKFDIHCSERSGKSINASYGYNSTYNCLPFDPL